MGEKRTHFPGRNTLGYRLLELAAVCGEVPAGLVGRIPGSGSYRETVLCSLRKGGLLRTYYQDRLRGYRLGRKAKECLLADCPGRFAFYLTGKTDTNCLKSEVSRRVRLHRIAEVHVAMMNAGVAVFRDEKPAVFSGREIQVPEMGRAAFYSSREVKEMGVEMVKIRGSRMAGVLLATSGAYIVYNCGPHAVILDYRAEQRAQVLLQMVLSRKGFPALHGDGNVSGVLFADGMGHFSHIFTEVDSRNRCFF